MKTTNAWGWLAAGVVALGLNGIYHDGGGEWAHRAANRVVQSIEERTGPALALATGRTDWFLAHMQVAARNQKTPCQMATAMARLQTRMVRPRTGMSKFEEMAAREEVGRARLEVQRARAEAMAARVRFTPAAWTPATWTSVEMNGRICPRVRVVVPEIRIPEISMPSLPRIPVVKVPNPVVDVNVTGSGPV